MAIRSQGLNIHGLRSEFFARFDQVNKGSVWQDLTTRIDSDNDIETQKFLGMLPAMREWGTGRLARGLITEEYVVKNLKYEMTLEVDRDEVSDDKTGQIRMRIGEMGLRAGHHKDFLLSQLLLNGATTGFNSYDGVSFFNDAHVSGDSGSQDNKLTTDVGTVAGSDLFPEPDSATLWGPNTAITAYNNAVAAMMEFVDDRGENMHRGMEGMTVVCSFKKLGTFLTAFNLQGGQGREGTPGTTPVSIPRVIAMPELTSASVWYLLKLDGVVIKPFVFQDREPIEFNQQEQNSESGFMQEVYRYGVRARYRMTYGYWNNAIQMTMTT